MPFTTRHINAIHDSYKWRIIYISKTLHTIGAAHMALHIKILFNPLHKNKHGKPCLYCGYMTGSLIKNQLFMSTAHS
jgi:hypothetical protein